MRKLISTMSALIMIVSLCSTSAFAEQNDFLTGNWKMEYSLGGAVIAEQAVTIYDDSTFEVMDEGQSEKGTWMFDGEMLSLTADGEEIKLKWDEGARQLAGEYSGMTVKLNAADEQDGEDVAVEDGPVGWN